MKVKSKAQTLRFLEKKVHYCKILPSLIYSADLNFSNLIEEISSTFNTPVIIRSSSHNEDTHHSSNAGVYTSVLNVDTSNTKDLLNAINEVVSSFKSSHLHQEEILIQPMLGNVQASGVALSCDMDTLSSYYIINYDTTGKTDSVTDGNGKNLQTYIEYKYSINTRENSFLDAIISAIKELEKILKNPFLDIEFAYDGKDIYIFQARPVVQENKNDLSHINLEKALFKLNKKIEKLNTPHPNLLGDFTMFGIMPDWNPAEIIGKKPKPLALSLYKELITDSVWAYQRNNYGYRNLRSHPLLVSFFGIAYIDIRVSFNSFIPKDLDKSIATKLVNFYLNTLKEAPYKHDKVEFDIILSCFDFTTKEKLDLLNKTTFSTHEVKEIKSSLLTLTNNVFSLYKKDLGKIDILKLKYDAIINSELSSIDKIYWLNEDCKRYGTLPFAGLARSAFIGLSFLKSFVKTKIISKQEYSQFLNSLNTISKQLNSDFTKLTKEEFLSSYGHLRPGTYEITSKRYDQNYEKYFSSSPKKATEESFQFTKKQLKLIDSHLKNNNIQTTSKQLIEFISHTIEAREYSKFIFTRSLSQILSLIEEYGEKFSISKEDLSFLDYQSILSLYSTLDYEDIKTLFQQEINDKKRSYQLTQGVKLPDLLSNAKEIYSFFNLSSSANFITLNAIEATIVHEKDIYTTNLTGKIICLKSADPGYDFLFTKNIGGLLTCYGGTNSHMAIRCAELNIPAVIGVGERDYLDLLTYSVISIDCNIEQIKRIQ